MSESNPTGPDPVTPPRKPARRRVLVILLVLTAVAAVPLAGKFVYSFVDALVNAGPDAYAQEWVADILIRHMEYNGGAWPRG